MTQTRNLLIDLSKHYGGASSRTLALLGGLSGKQNGLAVLNNSPVMQQAIAHQYNTNIVGNYKLDIRILTKLIDLIRQQKIHIIDTQNPQSQLWGYLAAAKTDAALVSTLNSWYFDEHGGSLKGRTYQLLQSFTNPYVDMFIAVSDEIRNRLLEIGVAKSRIALIPNAISVDVHSIVSDRLSLCRKFGFPDDAFICCSIGRLVEAKGYIHLLEAIAKVATTLPRLYCLIIGDGHLYQTLSDRVKQLGLQQRVQLAGNQSPNKTLQLLKSADMFVMPSISEGTPIALLEAAALKKPILASRVGGIPSILTSGIHALLTEPGDATALAKALKLHYEHPESTLQRAAKAQSHVLNYYGLNTQVEATKAAYEQAQENFHKRQQSKKLQVS